MYFRLHLLYFKKSFLFFFFLFERQAQIRSMRLLCNWYWREHIHHKKHPSHRSLFPKQFPQFHQPPPYSQLLCGCYLHNMIRRSTACISLSHYKPVLFSVNIWNVCKMCFFFTLLTYECTIFVKHDTVLHCAHVWKVINPVNGICCCGEATGKHTTKT